MMERAHFRLYRRWHSALGIALGAIATVIPSPTALHADGSAVEHVEVSAPILPRVSILYEHEGQNFPSAPADITALAHDAALTYDFLLGACPAKYPAIVVVGPKDPPTTPDQNATNFEQLAQCAYNEYVSKPYWIPALVDQVDICGTELGASWHLITEADIASITDADAQILASALATPNAQSFFGNLFFSLHVWVRGTDGTLKVGDLTPGASQRMSDSPVSASSTQHYESDLSLRCIRRTVIH
jgi:hypothetical protein